MKIRKYDVLTVCTMASYVYIRLSTPNTFVLQGGVISSSPAEQTEVQVDVGVHLEWHEVFDVVLHADTVRQQSAR